jgi:hypothetical protein
VDSIIKSNSQKIFILSVFDTPLVKTQSTIYFFLMAISAAFTEPSISSYFIFVSEKMSKIVSKDMRHKYVAKIGEYKTSWEN